MKDKVDAARIISARIRRYLESKQILGELIYIKVSKEKDVVIPLKEALAQLEGKILYYRNAVKSLIESIEGYDPKKHIEVNYISLPDIKNNVIDISINQDESQLLLLDTGEICEGRSNR